MLDIVPSYYHVQFKEQPMNQTWENGRKPNFESNIAPYFPNLGPKKFFYGFYLYKMLDNCMQFQEKLMIQTQENDEKPHFEFDLDPYWAQIWAQNFIFKNLASSVTRHHGQLSSCTTSEKTNDPVLRKLTDEWTDLRTRVMS